MQWGTEDEALWDNALIITFQRGTRQQSNRSKNFIKLFMSTEYLLKDRDRYATATLLPIKQKFPVALNLPSTIILPMQTSTGT